MGAALLIGLAVVAIILAAVIGYRIQKRRIQLWQQTAAGLGFQFAQEDPFGLLSLPFNLFERGDGRGCENVVWGTKDGLM